MRSCCPAKGLLLAHHPPWLVSGRGSASTAEGASAHALVDVGLVRVLVHLFANALVEVPGVI
jgi:putative NIF3 family GTP cyclohydrolase 1 type 2